MTLRNVGPLQYPQVSIAIWISGNSRRIASIKSACMVHSPPLKVIPPPFIFRISAFFESSAARDSAVHFLPEIVMQCRGQTATHAPHPMQCSGLGHTDLQVPQFTHKPETILCGCFCSPSGLWHQLQRNGQPFKKTVVRIPGPSNTANSSISKTIPSISAALVSMWFNHSPPRFLPAKILCSPANTALA